MHNLFLVHLSISTCRPKQVEIDKYTENKLCYKLAIFTRLAFRSFKILYHGPLEPPSHLLPFLANATPSYLVPTLIHKPDFRCYKSFDPWLHLWGHIEDAESNWQSCRQKKNSGKSRSLLTAFEERMAFSATQNGLRLAELCI